MLRFRRAVSAKRDYYEVLGVGRDAGVPEIKKAYRKMAMKYHPDRNPGDDGAEERFKEAAEAFEVLSDPQKRDLYNRFGHDGPSRAGFSGFSGADEIFSHFGDLFGDLFGNLGFGNPPFGWATPRARHEGRASARPRGRVRGRRARPHRPAARSL